MQISWSLDHFSQLLFCFSIFFLFLISFFFFFYLFSVVITGDREMNYCVCVRILQFSLCSHMYRLRYLCFSFSHTDRIWILPIKVLHDCIVDSLEYRTCILLFDFWDPDHYLGLLELFLITYQTRYTVLYIC